MRWLVINTDYLVFSDSLYEKNPGLEKESYAEQRMKRAQSLFGTLDFYPKGLRALGEEADEVIANNERLQRRWAWENKVNLDGWGWFEKRVKGWYAPNNKKGWAGKALAAQIKSYRPDVLVNLAMDGIPPDFFREAKGEGMLLVGQHPATELPEGRDWSVYDFCVSSFPPTLDWFRKQGIRCELLRLAFEPEVLAEVGERERIYPVTFIGSFSEIHRSRTQLLEHVSREVPLKVFGLAPKNHFAGLNLKSCYGGAAWGREMYEILAASRVTINHHGDIPHFANNLRLFEATGMGAALVTDAKPNLGELFEAGQEVEVYSNAEECVERIRRLLGDDPKRGGLAAAGQNRTLKEHTYLHRMEELIGLVKKFGRV